MIRAIWTVVVGALGLLLLAPAAFAQGTLGGGYGGPGGETQARLAAEQQVGALPFTGLEVTLAVVAGLALVAVGMTVRRAGRAR